MSRTQMVRPPGRAAEIRRPRSSDVAALSHFFAGLSRRTRVRRFFAPIMPTSAMLRLAGGAGEADAVIATAGGAIIGHAMAADRAGPDGDPMAEIGVVVADAWQGQGIGSALTGALIGRARARGVTALVMDVLPGNHEVLAMILGHWTEARTDHSADCVTVRVRLPQPEHPRAHAAPGPRPSGASEAWPPVDRRPPQPACTGPVTPGR